MTKQIVDLLKAAEATVKVVAFGTYTAPPAVPYCVVKPEFSAGRARFRIIGHFSPAALYDLEEYMRETVDATLDRWTGEDENEAVNELRYVEGSATGPQALSDDKSISMERVYEMPDFV